MWWHPFATTWTAKALVLGIPIILIAVFEGTFQLSVHGNGIAAVHTKNYVRYTWVYVPALVMLAVATLFGTIDSAAKIFHPFHVSKRGGVTAERSIM